METERMIGLREAVVRGTEGGLGPTGVPLTTAAAELVGQRAAAACRAGEDAPTASRRQSQVRILREADQATASGVHSVLPRREGRSFSLLRHGESNLTWPLLRPRRQRIAAGRPTRARRWSRRTNGSTARTLSCCGSSGGRR